jgi:predicted nucleotidyltransferase
MVVSLQEMAAYQATARERARQTRQRLAKRFERARKAAECAATLLKEQFNVARVVLFGSLVHPKLFHIHSDIDLAAWGLHERDYYRAIGQLQAIDAEFAIDLIRIEEAPPTLCAAIEQEGVPL